MKKEILVNIQKDIQLVIIGKYYKAEYESDLPETFEIDKIKSEDDDLYNLLEWVAYVGKKDYLNVLENLCLIQIQQEND